MRIALAIAMATLTLGLASQPMRGQTPVGDTSVLLTIRMVDTQTGWARWVDKLSDATMLLRTTDGGTHWKDVTPLSSSGRKVYVARITVLSPLIAWVVPAYIKGLFRTTDGGRSWRSIGVGGGDISFINPREGWRMISLNAWAGKEEVEIYRSTDGGDSWT